MKTYKTLTNAYTSAQKAGAKSFGSDYYAYANKVDEILTNTYKSVSARTLAKWNLAKFDKTLCALECTSEGTYKWTVIGHFDSDGLLYPMGTESQTKVIEDKKPRTHKPASAKGKVVLSKADKKAIRSECYKLAKGDIAEYDRLCKERGVDNGR